MAGGSRPPWRVAAWVPSILLLAFSGSCLPVRKPVPLEDGKESVLAELSKGSSSTAKDLLKNTFYLGARYPAVTLDPLTWTEDPFHDQYWRFLFYGMTWTRHLLVAYYDTGRPELRDKLLEILRSFCRADEARTVGSPSDPITFGYLYGAAFRALVLVNTMGKLERSGDLPPDLGRSLESALERLGTLLENDEEFPAASNHGLIQAAAMLAIAVNHPSLPEAAKWQAVGLDRLQVLMVRAVDADGVEVENSPFYHFYVLGFAFQIDQWARAFDIPLAPEFSATVDKMVSYATQVLQPDGHIPLMGASVDLDVSHMERAPYEGIAAGHPGFQFLYTLGAKGAPPPERGVVFPISGQAFLRSGFGTGPADVSSQTHVAFNVGPWRSRHNHLDVLGIDLYSAGARQMCDSGLFTYDPGLELGYFSGTRAHNTVVVDNLDQRTAGAVGAGRTLTGPSWVYQSGWHALYLGVVHRRAVLVLERDLMLVVDALESDAPHEYTQIWHLPVTVAIQGELDVNGLEADGATRMVVRQAFKDGLTLKPVMGAVDPLQGWVSQQYGKKDAAYVLEYHVTGNNGRFVTLLAFGPKASPSTGVTATVAEDGDIRAVACAPGAHYQVILRNLAAEGETVEVAAGTGSCP